MTVQRAWLDGEPTLDDLLTDPVTQAIMRIDGLTAEDVRAAVEQARARLRPSSEEAPRAA